MDFPFQRPVIYADPDTPLAPPRPDLYAGGNFRLAQNANPRNVRISGYIYNVGNASVNTPFNNVLTVSWYQIQNHNTISLPFTIRETIPAGGRIATPEAVSALIFYDQDPSANYAIELFVDVDNDIAELLSSNNYSLLRWRFYSPGFLQAEKQVSLEGSN